MCKDTGEIVSFRQGKNSQNPKVSHLFYLFINLQQPKRIRSDSVGSTTTAGSSSLSVEEEEEEDADSFDGEHRLQKKPVLAEGGCGNISRQRNPQIHFSELKAG